MPGQWDDSLKIFISENPQDFASWLLGEAQVKAKLLTEFKTRTIEADALLKVTLNGEDMSGLQVAEKNELLPITQLLASLVFTSELDKEWIIWRFNKMSDILRET